MGIAGAGNSGTLLATLFAPRLAERFGWATTFGLALLPVVVRRDPVRAAREGQPGAGHAATRWRDYVAVLREPDTLWLSFLYSLTFGGFVGFASFLTTFFHEQYHLSRVSAGDFTTIVVVAGSLLRPVGGWLSDRLGGYRLLLLLLAGVGDRASAPWPTLPPLSCRRAAAVRRHRAARHGQRRGVPAGAAALPGAHGHRHRHRRRGGRARRVLPAAAAGRREGHDRQLRDRPARCLPRRSWSARSSCSSWARAGRCAGSHSGPAAPESSVIANAFVRAASLRRTGHRGTESTGLPQAQ